MGWKRISGLATLDDLGKSYIGRSASGGNGSCDTTTTTTTTITT
jgi:hypothetical protein